MSDRSQTRLGPFTILVEPQMGENIGAAARALWNFGWRRMRLVAPRDGWPNPRAAALASGAGSLLDEAQVYADTDAALADLHTVYATTARPRELTKRVLTPEAAAREMMGLMDAGHRVGVMYGPERSGLLNEDIARASAIISVPVNPEFPSLNLGQCVLLLSYELRRLADATPPEQFVGERPELAEAGEVARLVDHMIDELEAAHFFFPEHKRPNMEANLRNMFNRAGLTGQDVRTLWGVVRALAEGPKRQRQRRSAPGKGASGEGGATGSGRGPVPLAGDDGAE
ncbi:RNA methyltransferase [Limibaculum sp. M0105]|uniref:RNA methyltransferase n=1 Tax=Thermohalobaculum xanthum TaxID=2753746 RepID=A0A8J7SEI9_9RHOB|nr:TrmH family RNA methyltransferase [Thermohalobaculum xanthum]MBK0398982.1 RNA methyltransferase [Thermohalobaculum xanthum]